MDNLKTTKRWMVRRDSGHFLAKNNRWYKSVACATDIKLYKTSGHALRALKIFGAPIVSDGHFESRGSVIAVYENDVIDRCGQISRGD
jgi:hypothetical protein